MLLQIAPVALSPHADGLLLHIFRLCNQIRRICGEDYQIKRELCDVIKQKELSDFSNRNQIALYSWII